MEIKDIRKMLADLLHDEPDDETLVNWLSMVGKQGGGLQADEDPNWAHQGVDALVKTAGDMENEVMQYLDDEKTVGNAMNIDNPGLARQVKEELESFFRRRSILEYAKQGLEGLAKNNPGIKRALQDHADDIAEVFTTLDGLVEVSPRSFLYPLIYGMEMGDDHPWVSILQPELDSLDREVSDLDVEAELTEFRENWHPEDMVLTGYMRDELPRWQRMAVQEHLENCDSCRARLEAIKTGNLLIMTVPRVWKDIKKAALHVWNAPVPVPVAAAGKDTFTANVPGFLQSIFGVGAGAGVVTSKSQGPATLDIKVYIIKPKDRMFENRDIEVGLVQLQQGGLILLARPKHDKIKLRSLDLRMAGDMAHPAKAICNDDGCIALVEPGKIVQSKDFYALVRVQYNDTDVVIGWHRSDNE